MALLIGLPLGRFVSAGSDAPGGSSSISATSPAGRSDIAQLERAVAQNPDSVRALTDLGLATLDRFRATADPSWLDRARKVLSRAEQVDPADARTLSGLGLLNLATHDFEQALAIGKRAAAANPDAVEPLAVIVDALVELGRYDEAVDTADEMASLKPGVATYARVSYLRELFGDHAGALEAMTQARTASSAPADVSYISTLLGDLHLGEGDLGRAEGAYDAALRASENYAPARTGLARVAAARGDLARAAELLDRSTRQLPVPEAIGIFGDVLAAAGRPAEAAAQYELVRSIELLNRSSGIAVDLELARFEATHARDPGGRPEAAVELARAALQQRPTIFAEDALGWALRQAGRPEEALAHAREAVRLGTRHAELWWHLAAIEADLGMRVEAAEHLTKAFEINPYLTLHDLPEARAVARSLNVAPAEL